MKGGFQRIFRANARENTHKLQSIYCDCGGRGNSVVVSTSWRDWRLTRRTSGCKTVYRLSAIAAVPIGINAVCAFVKMGYNTNPLKIVVHSHKINTLRR